MGKNKGSSNYKMAGVNRLLDLVESYLPLGKDEWERLASKFNATRPRSWAERGFDSLHRKFKALYSTRKPTGKANIPPHIEQTKELKRAVDEKVNVVEMDDCAGVDSDEDPDEENDEEEERRIEPDFSFDYEPDGSLFHDRGGDGGAVDGGVDASNSASFAIFTGTEALAVDPKKTRFTSVSKSKTVKPKSGQRVGNRDETGTRTSSTLQSSSNCLEGADLRSFRSSLEAKRSLEDVDLECAEASFAKSKRVRALNATDTLRQKVASIPNASTNRRGGGGAMMKMMLILREETKTEAPEPMKNHAAATNLSLVMSAINPRRRKRKSIVARKVLREKNAFP
ncbi:hypothetical protein F444_03767 [Phytophthora nicotianae P1976]|uniref:DUF6818 domain-containing protein n=1 Tax=Phytophthora nicotianae P1976 TaxID=1317066 RepID=A0A081ASZ0_PHYNI|nr:hypothetical protein F444_03767 [Phytophthora nicotianae P1976]